MSDLEKGDIRSIRQYTPGEEARIRERQARNIIGSLRKSGSSLERRRSDDKKKEQVAKGHTIREMEAYLNVIPPFWQDMKADDKAYWIALAEVLNDAYDVRDKNIESRVAGVGTVDLSDEEARHKAARARAEVILNLTRDCDADAAEGIKDSLKLGRKVSDLEKLVLGVADEDVDWDPVYYHAAALAVLEDPEKETE
ncbi:MAG: hypothetical protein U1D26_01775 [Patescibacteria group bacterium]|nr:hypothetical protein [Patescibacteria group bacterium]